VKSEIRSYISIDIDVLDPSVAPGTGTPLVGGMMQSTLHALLTALIRRTKVVGFDIVEVNPMLDINNRTSDLAIEIIFHVLTEVYSSVR
jgi:arginase family enzyme